MKTNRFMIKASGKSSEHARVESTLLSSHDINKKLREKERADLGLTEEQYKALCKERQRRRYQSFSID